MVLRCIDLATEKRHRGGAAGAPQRLRRPPRTGDIVIDHQLTFAITLHKIETPTVSS
jgi:hypothetical protein